MQNAKNAYIEFHITGRTKENIKNEPLQPRYKKLFCSVSESEAFNFKNA